MVSPWDSNRESPDGWRIEEESTDKEFQIPDPHQEPKIGDFPTPTISNVGGDNDTWPSVFTGGLEQGEPTWNTTTEEISRRSPSISIALVSTGLAVALLVFFGLRLVRISVSGEDLTARETQNQTTVVTLLAPTEGDATGTSTTVASSPSTATFSEANWDEIARSVVYFEVAGSCNWVGSGTLILDGSYVLTNWHVSGGGECPMRVGLTENFSAPPSEFYSATVIVWDSQIDLAVVRLQTSSGAPFVPPGRKPVTLAANDLALGSPVWLIGYPVLREEQFDSGARYTLTLTDGKVSGIEDFGKPSSYDPTDSRNDDYQVWGEYIKHTAEQNGGVSGGGAFNVRGELVAIPTAGGDKLELMRSVRFAKILIEQIK